MRTAVVTGSFDPITAGHVDIVARAAKLFDEVLVVAMINEEKKYLLTNDQKVEIMADAVAHLPNVRADFWPGMQVDCLRMVGACAIIKGIRNGKDAEYEQVQANFNKTHLPECETLMFFADEKYAHISSSEVKRRLRAGESVEGMVTPLAENLMRLQLEK
jgi:pantetheine-phosphate adenylyltransferase